ncbi:hypothetical protein DL93DRAFT_2166173, partial [Clavulina sp. PMI_390]
QQPKDEDELPTQEPALPQPASAEPGLQDDTSTSPIPAVSEDAGKQPSQEASTASEPEPTIAEDTSEAGVNETEIPIQTPAAALTTLEEALNKDTKGATDVEELVAVASVDESPAKEETAGETPDPEADPEPTSESAAAEAAPAPGEESREASRPDEPEEAFAKDLFTDGVEPAPESPRSAGEAPAPVQDTVLPEPEVAAAIIPKAELEPAVNELVSVNEPSEAMAEGPAAPAEEAAVEPNVVAPVDGAPALAAEEPAAAVEEEPISEPEAPPADLAPLPEEVTEEPVAAEEPAAPAPEEATPAVEEGRPTEPEVSAPTAEGPAPVVEESSVPLADEPAAVVEEQVPGPEAPAPTEVPWTEVSPTIEEAAPAKAVEEPAVVASAEEDSVAPIVDAVEPPQSVEAEEQPPPIVEEPAVEAKEPLVEEPTPAVEVPADEATAPADEARAEEATPTAEVSTPEAAEPAPATEEPVPAAEEPTLAVEEVAPAAEEPAPAVEEAAPAIVAELPPPLAPKEPAVEEEPSAAVAEEPTSVPELEPKAPAAEELPVDEVAPAPAIEEPIEAEAPPAEPETLDASTEPSAREVDEVQQPEASASTTNDAPSPQILDDVSLAKDIAIEAPAPALDGTIAPTTETAPAPPAVDVDADAAPAVTPQVENDPISEQVNAPSESRTSEEEKEPQPANEQVSEALPEDAAPVAGDMNDASPEPRSSAVEPVQNSDVLAKGDNKEGQLKTENGTADTGTKNVRFSLPIEDSGTTEEERLSETPEVLTADDTVAVPLITPTAAERVSRSLAFTLSPLPPLSLFPFSSAPSNIMSDLTSAPQAIPVNNVTPTNPVSLDDKKAMDKYPSPPASDVDPSELPTMIQMTNEELVRSAPSTTRAKPPPSLLIQTSLDSTGAALVPAYTLRPPRLSEWLRLAFPKPQRILAYPSPTSRLSQLEIATTIQTIPQDTGFTSIIGPFMIDMTLEIAYLLWFTLSEIIYPRLWILLVFLASPLLDGKRQQENAPAPTNMTLEKEHLD